MDGRAISIEELLTHERWLRQLAVHVVRDEALAKDLVQETWMAALQGQPAERRTTRAWLAGVLRNQMRMNARGEVRRHGREQAFEDRDRTVPSPDALMERLQARQWLVEQVQKLDEPYRSTILLHYCEGLSAAEIARRLGVPPGTIRWRHKYAIERLRKSMSDSDPKRRLRGSLLVPIAATEALAVHSANSGWLSQLTAGKGLGNVGIALATVLSLVLASWLAHTPTATPPAPEKMTRAVQQPRPAPTKTILTAAGAKSVPAAIPDVPPSEPQLLVRVTNSGGDPILGATAAIADREVGITNMSGWLQVIPDLPFPLPTHGYVHVQAPDHEPATHAYELGETVLVRLSTTIAEKPDRFSQPQIAKARNPVPLTDEQSSVPAAEWIPGIAADTDCDDIDSSTSPERCRPHHKRPQCDLTGIRNRVLSNLLPNRRTEVNPRLENLLLNTSVLLTLTAVNQFGCAMLDSGQERSALQAADDANAPQGNAGDEHKDPEIPQIVFMLSHSQGSCELYPGQTEIECPDPVQAGDIGFVFAEADGGKEDGLMEVFNTCETPFANITLDTFALKAEWQAPQEAPVECTLVAKASRKDGTSSEVFMHVTIAKPEPPKDKFPHIEWQLDHSQGTCGASSGQENQPCKDVIPAGSTALLFAKVDWGDLTPGVIELFDDCGENFTDIETDGELLQAAWLAPKSATACFIQVKAANKQGAANEANALVFVDQGSASDPPDDTSLPIEMLFEHTQGGCTAHSDLSPFQCGGPMLAGTLAHLVVFPFWGQLTPGFIEIVDDCGGELVDVTTDGELLKGSWQAPDTAIECTIKAAAESKEGVDNTLVMTISVTDKK